MSASIRRMNELTDEIKALKAKIAEAKQLLNDFIIQFDFGGSITEQRSLIKQAQAVLNDEKSKASFGGKT